MNAMASEQRIIKNPLLRGMFYGTLFSIPLWALIIWGIWWLTKIYD